MKPLRIVLIFVAIAANAEDGPRIINITVSKPFIERALEESELDRLIRADLIDASRNIVDWQKRRRIRQLCLKLEAAQ